MVFCPVDMLLFSCAIRTPPTPPQALIDQINQMAAADLNEAFRIKSKSARSDKLSEIAS